MVSVLQMVLFTMCVTLGLRYVDAGRSAILAYTTPLWVLPLATLFLGERLSVLKIIGFFLGLLGVLLLFNPVTFNWHNHLAVIGSGYLILAAFSLRVVSSILKLRRLIVSDKSYPGHCRGN